MLLCFSCQDLIVTYGSRHRSASSPVQTSLLFLLEGSDCRYLAHTAAVLKDPPWVRDAALLVFLLQREQMGSRCGVENLYLPSFPIHPLTGSCCPHRKRDNFSPLGLELCSRHWLQTLDIFIPDRDKLVNSPIFFLSMTSTWKQSLINEAPFSCLDQIIFNWTCKKKKHYAVLRTIKP